LGARPRRGGAAHRAPGAAAAPVPGNRGPRPQSTDQGYKGFFGATAGTVKAGLTKAPNARLAGGIQGFPWWADTQPVKQYRDAMRKYAPDADYADPVATAAWAALEVTRKAAAGIGDNPARKDIVAGLHTFKDEDLGGLLPQKVTYTKGKNGPLVNCIWLYKLEKGEFTTLPHAGPSGNSVTSGPLKSACMRAPATG
jgi:branched-chain amino acid transport system substrate-binding protein